MTVLHALGGELLKSRKYRSFRSTLTPLTNSH
jgi:hypothetical protein